MAEAVRRPVGGWDFRFLDGRLVEDPPFWSYRKSMDTNRTSGAMAVIRNSRGELLLHLRDDIPGIAWPGHWSFLGGGCDPGEAPREAIVRELLEEAGLVVDDLVELGEVLDNGGQGSGQLLTAFAATWNGDARALSLTEGQKLDWIAPGNLDTLKVPPFVREFLDLHLPALG